MSLISIPDNWSDNTMPVEPLQRIATSMVDFSTPPSRAKRQFFGSTLGSTVSCTVRRRRTGRIIYHRQSWWFRDDNERWDSGCGLSDKATVTDGARTSAFRLRTSPFSRTRLPAHIGRPHDSRRSGCAIETCCFLCGKFRARVRTFDFDAEYVVPFHIGAGANL